MNHRACVNCGKYNKREALNVYKKLDKKSKKASKTEKTEKSSAKK
jgi:hypothetical protein